MKRLAVETRRKYIHYFGKYDEWHNENCKKAPVTEETLQLFIDDMAQKNVGQTSAITALKFKYQILLSERIKLKK